MDDIQSKAFEWATDYKPWETDLEYREYARHGYEQGYKAAIKDILKNSGIHLVSRKDK